MGDEAYAVEELRAEICSAILAAETGVPMSQAHIDNHAAYLKCWVKVVAADPMAISLVGRVDARNREGARQTRSVGMGKCVKG